VVLLGLALLAAGAGWASGLGRCRAEDACWVDNPGRPLRPLGRPRARRPAARRGGGVVIPDPGEHDGHKVFVQFLADGRMKLVLHDQRMKISGGPHTMSGITRSGRPFTNVGLEPHQES
jgi:hypothetical protein